MDKRLMRDLPLGVSPRTDKTYVRTKENAGAVRGSDVAEDGKGFFSIEHPEKLFTFDGSLKLKRFSPPNAYRQFFEHGGRIAKERGSTVLRGPRYVCALDQNLAFAHKLQILLDDYNDALQTLLADGEPTKEATHRLYRLGTFDYLKNSSVTLLNALIGSEKFGFFRLDDAQYQRARTAAVRTTELSVRAQYAFMAGDYKESQACLMLLAENSSELEKVALELRETADRSAREFRKDLPRPLLTRPELSHPASVGGAALHAAERLKHAPPDTILALPTGGTEYAYALQYAFSCITGKKPEVILAPISVHSTRKHLENESDVLNVAVAVSSGQGEEEERNLLAFLKLKKNADALRGKQVLIADDNASSGMTLQLAKDIVVNSFTPKSIDVSVAESDLIRTRERERWRDERADPASFPTIPVATDEALRDAVAVLPVSRYLQKGTNLARLQEFRRIARFYETSTGNSELDELLRDVERKNATRYFLREIHDSPNPRDNIYNFKDSFLSNFHPIEVSFSVPGERGARPESTRVYPSVEHAFQAAKFPESVLRRIRPDAIEALNEYMHQRYPSSDPTRGWKPVRRYRDIQEVFSGGAYTPGQAKVMADKLRDLGYIRSDWFDIRLHVMGELLLKKFKNPALREQLLQTGDRLIVEGNNWGDSYWGVVARRYRERGEIGYTQIKNGFGQNMLGLLLMEIRKRLKEEKNTQG